MEKLIYNPQKKIGHEKKNLHSSSTNKQMEKI